jgi:hypothetical protein
VNGFAQWAHVRLTRLVRAANPHSGEQTGCVPRRVFRAIWEGFRVNDVPHAHVRLTSVVRPIPPHTFEQ